MDNKPTNNQEYKHQNKERLCFCCNELQDTKEELNLFTIRDRGHMSDFDLMHFTIQLCDKCVEEMEVEPEWFDNEVSYDKKDDSWLNESYIYSMIESFPIHNQEYIHNAPENYSAPQYVLTREEWIAEQEDMNEWA